MKHIIIEVKSLVNLAYHIKEDQAHVHFGEKQAMLA